jgi:threonine dehydratase
VAARTPLIPLDLDGGTGHPVRLKAEFLQPIGAFKIRGAWTAIRRLPPEVRAKGVVTSSSGNHGLGVAWAAHRFGIPAVVVMAQNATTVKVDGVRRLGARVVFAGAIRGPEQDAEARRIAAGGMTLIPPFDHPDVIAGQATCALEILQDWPETAAIVVPTGGGGLLAGTCSAAHALGRALRIVAVEPAGVPKLSAAFSAGGPVALEHGTSIADGLLTRSVGAMTWPIIREYVREVVSVGDADIRAAMAWLGRHGIRVEPSGAITTAAVLAGHIRLTGPTVLISTGGNVDPARYAELVA